jgi:cation diffusion facilitator CzcD-associated flavoprotein CzcO
MEGAKLINGIPDIVAFSPGNRKLKIIVIGAGVSGILIAYKIQKHLENVELKIYERNGDIGGTWLLNKYPGCACDIPSHAYSYPFAPNPDWPSFFSSSQDIWAYLDRVANTWDLRKYMAFSTDVTSCHWQEATSTWKVKLRKQDPMSGELVDFEDECDVLLQATGVLNNYKMPAIDGIETFKGKLIHTARWPDAYQADTWKKEKVAVIGSGASSIQTVPSMQPHVKHMSVFIRTPTWFVEFAGHSGKNTSYTAEQKATFRQDPTALVAHVKLLEDRMNSGFAVFLKDSPEQQGAAEYLEKRIAAIVQDTKIVSKLTPRFRVGCRRMNPGDPYLEAITKDNVKVIFEEACKITETGIIGRDGTVAEVDTIICATGFDTSFRPAFPIVGRNNVNLQEKWKAHPEAYLGVAVPDFPNFFTFIGPSWPIGNGSVMGPLNAVSEYVIKFLTKMQRELISSFEVKQDITDAFNRHVQNFMTRTVWTDNCRSWYKDNDTNRVNALWPGSSLHYIETIQTPRYEDFNFKHSGGADANIWDFLGNGFSPAEFAPAGAKDRSPYIALDRVDKAWLG